MGSWTQKTYTIAAAHHSVSVQWAAYFLDSWDGESYQLYVDGIIRISQPFSGGATAMSSCGVGWNDGILVLTVGPFDHTSSSITLIFYTTLDEGWDNESWGLKNIVITVWPCDAACVTCSGGGSNQCTSCNTGNFLHPNTVGQCLDTCPAGFWEDSSTNKCIPCYNSGAGPYYSCVTCSGGGNNNNCNSCGAGRFLHPNTGGQCLDTCPAGFWGDSSTNKCMPCYTSGAGPYYSCATCSGGGNNNNCNSCGAGRFLHPNTGGQCLDTCPDGFWGDSSTNKCMPCYNSGVGPSYSCFTCSGGGSSQCTSCNAGKLLHPNFGGQCLDTCPDGFWGDSFEKKCMPCYSSGVGPYYFCATCSASGDNNCNLCHSGYYLHPNTGGHCLDTCPDGSWGDSSTNKCMPCHISGVGPYYSCATCSASGDNNCKSCGAGRFLHPNTGGQCLGTCPDSFWGDSATNKCMPCYNNGVGPSYTCATCSGGGSNQCTSCNAGKFLHPNTGGQCLIICPNGFWGDGSTNKCMPCHISGVGPYYSCVTCSAGGNNDCNSCPAGSFLHPNTGGQCLNPCPDGYWGDSTVNQCMPCYSSGSSPFTCKTCTAGTSSSCSSCYTSTYLHNGECLDTCPTGFWEDTSTNTCQPCYYSSSGSSPFTCHTCSGPADNECDSCFSGTFLYSGQCLDSCPDGYWGDTSTHTCQSCFSSGIGPSYTCTTCSAGTDSDCNSCDTGFFLHPNSGGKCLDSCPPGYWDDTSTNTCESCYTNITGPYYTCATCSGGGANDNCDSCHSGTFLHASQCISSCPDGFWEDISTNKCQFCFNSTAGPAFSCATCISGESKGCTSCPSGTFLYPNTSGQCLSQCPEDYWGDTSTNTCQVCSSSTANMSGCAGTAEYKVASFLQASATSFSAASVGMSAALQGSNTASGMFVVNLVLCLSAIESISNMRYLNINHSSFALGAYSGLSSALIPNWIATFNKLDNDQLVFHYGAFEKEGMSALYLDNYGDSLTEKMVYCALFLIMLAASTVKKINPTLNSRIGRYHAIAFGLFLSSVFGQIQSQLLFAVLQLLRTDLLISKYSQFSYFMAYFTTFAVIGLQILCFFKLKSIFTFKRRQIRLRRVNFGRSAQTNLTPSHEAQRNEQKFKMIFDSFKEDSKNRFFFSFWMTAFNTVYILLIILLQNVPVIQCLSIVVLTLAFTMFSAILQPMKTKSTAFLYFFNFGCILFIAILNLALAIRDVLNSYTSDNDDFGKAIYYSIMVNTGVNLIVGLGGTVLQIYSFLMRWRHRCKTSKRKTNATRRKRVQSPIVELKDKTMLTKQKNSKVTISSIFPSQKKVTVVKKKIARKDDLSTLRINKFMLQTREAKYIQSPQIKVNDRYNRNSQTPAKVTQRTNFNFIQEC